MRYLDAAALRGVLPPAAARRAIASAFEDIARGVLSGSLRTSFDVSEGTTLLMPAVSERHLGLKVLHLRQANPAKGLPAIIGDFFLYARDTGELLAAMDGTELTGLRTGALAGHATARLAPQGATIGAVLGAGHQGYYQARALAEAAPLEELRLWNRTPQRAYALAQRLRQELPRLRIAVSATPADAVRGAEAATLATATETPLIARADVSGEIHLNAMGAYRPEMCEIAVDLIGSATQVLVDDVDGARAEAGDLLQAAQAQRFDMSAVKSLQSAGPRSGITIFKSVGAAVFDLAVAEAALLG